MDIFLSVGIYEKAIFLFVVFNNKFELLAFICLSLKIVMS